MNQKVIKMPNYFFDETRRKAVAERGEEINGYFPWQLFVGKNYMTVPV